MRSLTVFLLILNSCCIFSQIVHEAVIIVGCSENSSTEVMMEFDGDELWYVDFDREEVEFTVPRYLVPDPVKTLGDIHLYSDAKKGRRACSTVLAFCKAEGMEPQEETDAPQSVLYPAEEVELGVENILVCLVSRFYPPFIRVTWTKNGRPVSEEASLSRYYPDKDLTFHQFSTLTFTPSEGDVYSCSVEHVALERPQTTIWEAEFDHQSPGPDVFCAVGLVLGLLGTIAGAVLFAKSCQVVSVV